MSKWRARIAGFLAPMVLTVLSVVTACSSGSTPSTPSSAPPLPVSLAASSATAASVPASPSRTEPRQGAPDLLLASKDGQFRLSEQRGKVLLLYFSFPGWPTCGLEAPALGKIHSEYQDRGVRVVAINILPGTSTLEEWIAFWSSKGAGSVLWAQDVQGRAIPDYRLLVLGTEVILDRQGRVAFRSDGPVKPARLRTEIEKTLAVTASAPAPIQSGAAVPILPALHGPPYVYNTRPPTSGSHLAQLGPYGLSNTPLDAKAVVHNMEHGAVVIWYQPDDPDLAEQVRTLVGGLGSRCLVAGPYLDMDYKIAVTAWGRLLGLGNFDADAIGAFVTAYRGELGPEARDPRVGCKVYPP